MGGIGSGSGGYRPKAGRRWVCAACGAKNAPGTKECADCAVPRSTTSRAGGARVLPHPSVPAKPEQPATELDESQAPDVLSVEERLIWMELGALALKKGKTLAFIKAYPFRLLCANAALERRYAKSVTEAGSANHRGMIQAVDKEMLRFGLLDFGKESPKAKPAVNPFAAAFGGTK